MSRETGDPRDADAVIVIFDALAGGETFKTIIKDYRITIDDIRDRIAFACDEHRLGSYQCPG
ncbi:MAG TPA: DUF433 domain-containing protein [Gemmataceae bacterium]|nr:DUF433 domain-containing protein [Gemmataceae bacterium]